MLDPPFHPARPLVSIGEASSRLVGVSTRSGRPRTPRPNAIVRMERLLEWESRVCLSLNRLNQRPLWGRVNAIASRLGDGVFWYVLMLCLPVLYGMPGLRVSLVMAACGAVGLTIYKLIKTATARPRPCSRQEGMHCTVAPLDLYSFPSGHTMHAVAFSILLVNFDPRLGILVIPFSLLVACSRMVLGLHYPTDVAAGALIGAVVAGGALALC